MTKYYVLSIGNTPWILTPEGRTKLECERAINWQNRGQPSGDIWRICTYKGVNENGCRIFTVHGNDYVIPDRSIYTQEGWDRYCKEFS